MILIQSTLILSSLTTIGAFSSLPLAKVGMKGIAESTLQTFHQISSPPYRSRHHNRVLVKRDDEGSIDANSSFQIDQEDMDRHINVASDLRDQDRNSATSDFGASKKSLSTTTETVSSAAVNATKDKRVTTGFPSEKIKQNVKKHAQNINVAAKKIFNSQFGSRGEKYIVAQALVIYSVALGHIPLLKNFFHALFGPLLFIGGLGMTGLGIKQLNGSFTPFFSPVPSGSGGKVITSGLYKYVRHPIYAGNLAAMVGWSVTTGSAMRLLLSLVYYLVVDRKSRREEEALMMEFGSAYQTYKVKVPNRFFPERSMNDLLDKFSKRGNKEQPVSVKSSEEGAMKKDGAKEMIRASESEPDQRGTGGTNFPNKEDNRQNKTKRNNSGLFP